MPRRALVLLVSTVLLTGSVATAYATGSRGASPTAHAAHTDRATACKPGARTLSHRGDHVYPDMGNGGYTSLHTDVHLVYDAPSNQFLPGNHVVLKDRATQCLSNFSLDFERSNADATAGPDLTVQSVTVNGKPATFTFKQPTFPGDPRGMNDPRPAAHQASQYAVVGGPKHNPLPPACSPQPTGNDVNADNGTPCPKTKLVITPKHPLPQGKTFTVSVSYTGRPGVHIDGDGLTEGWFRANQPAGDGGFVTTEPVATMDWMPLNNHPTAKPTYDFYETVNQGRTAIANGRLVSQQDNAADTSFPAGSTTFHWRSLAPVASYLVGSSVGAFDLTSHVSADGIRYYEAQSSSLSDPQKQANQEVMNQQQDITDFQSQFNGPFPFKTNGVLVGTPSASFEEEMQTMITFAGGHIDLDTFNHENMHQWWGDNVTESNFDMTFFKEGMATLGEFLFHARTAQDAAGGAGTAAGKAAFQKSLVDQFNQLYASGPGFWKQAPSNPTPASLFNGNSTYERPGATYLALRQILGAKNFHRALVHIQKHFGGATITEAQLEKQFASYLPKPSKACTTRLGTFFDQWFDTGYPKGGKSKPQLTGPGLTGPGFYGGGCKA